jgi:hypothetical protein
VTRQRKAPLGHTVRDQNISDEASYQFAQADRRLKGFPMCFHMVPRLRGRERRRSLPKILDGQDMPRFREFRRAPTFFFPKEDRFVEL